MASTLCQKLLTIFVKKNKILYGSANTILFKFHQRVVSIMERLLTSNVSIRNGNIKYPIGKSIFAVNLSLKLFRAVVANADIESLKSLHTFLKKCLYHILVKFEQNRMVQTTRIFELLNKKKPDFL